MTLQTSRLVYVFGTLMTGDISDFTLISMTETSSQLSCSDHDVWQNHKVAIEFVIPFTLISKGLFYYFISLKIGNF